jgi:tetratricopeptide (TPR) repeat protein
MLAALGALFALVFIRQAVTTPTGWANSAAKEESYNRLVEGFQRGELSLDQEAPPGLVALAHPYDPEANAPYRHPPYELHNLSYYRGRLYIYFGVVPALILFWPWQALTGGYLFHREAAAIFCTVGFLASLGLLGGLGRRYFPRTGRGALLALGLALAFLSSAPLLLQRADLCEVPIACGYALTMLALGAIWLTLHDRTRQAWWLAGASLAMGLAVGARPTLVFGGVMLLVPWLLRPAGSPPWRLLACACVPLALCGVGLMAYNQLRFGSPFDFGQRYQLAVDDQGAVPHFSLSYLWFNFRVDFLAPVRWSRVFPYVGEIAPPPLPLNHGWVEDAFGALANLPILCWALAAPLGWRGREGEARRALRGFLLAVALLFGASTLVLGLFYWNASRYEMDFLPSLAILSVAGILGVERSLSGRPLWLWASRAAAALALAFSIGFIGLDSVEHYGDERVQVGLILQGTGRAAAAVPQFEAAIRAGVASAGVDNFLGNAMLQARQEPKAAAYYEDALRLNPDFGAAQFNLANLFAHQGRFPEAEVHYRAALRVMPDSAAVHENLAAVLARMGRAAEARRELAAAATLRSGANP